MANMFNSDLIFSCESKLVLQQINMRRQKEFTGFKPKQLSCIRNAITGDTIGVLPTGYGKSLIFESLPYFMDMKRETKSIVFLICPLNSIILEQLGRYGSAAVQLDEQLLDELNTDTDSPTMKRIRDGEISYVIGHPECFITKKAFKLFHGEIWQASVTHLVVDEAHCIVTWGNGFREKYQQLTQLRSMFGEAKTLALTATATIKMQTEIAKHLSMETPTVIDANMDRPNIKIHVMKRPPSAGGKNTVEASYNSIIQPLVNELREKKDSFPKTIVYSKLKWCGYGQEVTERPPTDNPDAESISSFVAQYHSPCTAGVCILL
jgi:superfamily II DNA helicase RecQ